MIPTTSDLAARVMARCDDLAGQSEESGRLTRRYGTPALRAAQEMTAGWMREAGLTVRRDAPGNLIGRRHAIAPGAKTLLLGSHLDSVRDAGRYDGPMGVLVAIAAVEALAETRLPVAIEIYAFADEEGLRFHTSYLGSRPLVGALDPATLEVRDEEGVSVAEAMRAFGGDPGAIGSARRDPATLLGYIEAHIEQGPVLERLGLPVGVVTDIIGQTKAVVTYTGTAGHAGTTPMAMRKDALAAAAEFTLAVESTGNAAPGLVATVGRLTVEPGATNVIPGRVALSLDIRHADDATWRKAFADLVSEAERIADRRGDEVELATVMETPGVACDPALTAALERAISAAGLPPHRLVSGAGHDAVPLSGEMPVAMLFVRCKDGLSHNPAESITADDCGVAIDVLRRTILSLAESA